MNKQKQIKVTEQVRKQLLASTDDFATHALLKLANDYLAEAVLNVTEGHEDAPELVLVFKCLSLNEANLLTNIFGLREVNLFGGRLPDQKFSSCVELSGYVVGEEWSF